MHLCIYTTSWVITWDVVIVISVEQQQWQIVIMSIIADIATELTTLPELFQSSKSHRLILSTALHKVCVCLFSCSDMSNSLKPPWTVARQALSLGFLRQEDWNGLPFPPPGDLSDPRIEPVTSVSPALASEFFNTSTTWEVLYKVDALMCSLEMRKQRPRGNPDPSDLQRSGHREVCLSPRALDKREKDGRQCLARLLAA